jgi:hypothetical protein
MSTVLGIGVPFGAKSAGQAADANVETFTKGESEYAPFLESAAIR